MQLSRFAPKGFSIVFTSWRMIFGHFPSSSLSVESRRANIAFAPQVVTPMLYNGEQVRDGFKADVIVARQLILEIKSIAAILAAHEMQLRTYLRVSGIRIGLLLNFNAPCLMDGLRRYVVQVRHRQGSGTTPLAPSASSPSRG